MKQLWRFLKTLFLRHCKRSEAIPNVDLQWIALGCHPRNDVCGGFLKVLFTFLPQQKQEYSRVLFHLRFELRKNNCLY